MRNETGLTGTKYSCDVALCGACTVLLGGPPVRPCSVPVAGRQIGLADLAPHLVLGKPAPCAGRVALRHAQALVHAALAEIDDDAERVRRALELAGGNRERAASMLGIGRTTLWRRMKELGVEF